eukprot:SM000010S04233  [mRNA]  locus=s10:447624:449972:+ [translate_table: standard]
MRPRYTLPPAALLLGCTASVLWVAQGTYLTLLAKSHAAASGISEATVLGQFNGEFWSIMASNQGKAGDFPPGTLRLLFLAFLVCMTFGTIIISLLREPAAKQHHSPIDDLNERESTFVTMLGLLQSRRTQLLLPVMVYTGLQQAFIWGDFTRDIISPHMGLAWVPGVMAIYGGSDAISSAAAGFLASSIKSLRCVLAIGITAQLVVALLLFWHRSEPVSIILSAVLWGMGDAVCNTNMSALLGALYSGKIEAAFAQWRTWQSAATSLVFFASPHILMPWKLLMLGTLGILSLAALLALRGTDDDMAGSG